MTSDQTGPGLHSQHCHRRFGHSSLVSEKVNRRRHGHACWPTQRPETERLHQVVSLITDPLGAIWEVQGKPEARVNPEALNTCATNQVKTLSKKFDLLVDHSIVEGFASGAAGAVMLRWPGRE